MSQQTNNNPLVYRYEAAFPTHNLSWCSRADSSNRLAVSSYLVEYVNKIEVLAVVDKDDPDQQHDARPRAPTADQQEPQQPDDETEQVVKSLCTVDHPYPPTQVMWLPSSGLQHSDLLVTTGDYLRFWQFHDDGNNRHHLSMKACLNSNDKSDFCAPLTGFDWSACDPSVLATCSIDTTVCVWNVDTQSVVSQLIAHDKEVYGISFSPTGSNVFCSCGGDGSVRVFDLRSLDHCTVLYEDNVNAANNNNTTNSNASSSALLRCAWSPLEPNYILTFGSGNSGLTLLDIRNPGQAVQHLGAMVQGQSGPNVMNACGWAPRNAGHCYSCGEDGAAVIWALDDKSGETYLDYKAEAEINSLAWVRPHTNTMPSPPGKGGSNSNFDNEEWVAISFGNYVEVLPV